MLLSVARKTSNANKFLLKVFFKSQIILKRKIYICTKLDSIVECKEKVI